MKLYIFGPPDDGEGPYSIATEDGEVLAQHWCSDVLFAHGDLEARRPERQAAWRERFGGYTVSMATEEERKRLVRASWQRYHDADHPGDDPDERERCMVCKESAARVAARSIELRDEQKAKEHLK